MSAVSEDVLTSEQTASSAAETNPETLVAAAAPAPEANGSAQPVAVGGQAPAPTASVSSPQAVADEPQGVDQSDFESMFKELSEGDVVVGTVVHIDKDGVLVDVGSKSEGIVRPNELSKEPFNNIEDVVKVGESIKVVVIGRDNEDGNLLLSKKRADFEKAWDKVIDALNDGTILHAMVTERVKGGLVVDLGIRGFVPASHVGSGDFKHQNLDKYVGQSVPLKVIEVDRDRRKVVLSHREATQAERETKKAETIASLKEGDVRKGIVRRVTDYGAFIDLGGIDGLLHVSEMSWSRIKHPSEVVKNGQELDVMILKLRLDQGRISLGLRQILPDPWSEIADKFHVGDTIKAQVSRLVPFGAFVQLEDGVEAIIPNSELSDRRVSKPSDVVNPGDEVEAKIIEIRPDERKMTLSIRRLVEANAPREPYMPEPEMGGGGGRGGRDRDRDRDRGEGGGGGGSRGGRREGRGGRGGRESGYFDGNVEDDYKEYKNYRATQREETFGTSLADVLGDHFGSFTEEAEAEAETEASEETKE
jgi:predicted RNA-binding protein with RPS1 domain